MPKVALIAALFFVSCITSNASDLVSDHVKAFEHPTQAYRNDPKILMAQDEKQPKVYSIIGKNDLKLVISKCRQDECSRTWIKSETKIGDLLYFVVTVSSETIDHKSNWENGAVPTADEDHWHLSCSPNHPFINDIIIENDGGSSTPPSEDASAIWNAVCHKSFGVLQ